MTLCRTSSLHLLFSPRAFSFRQMTHSGKSTTADYHHFQKQLVSCFAFLGFGLFECAALALFSRLSQIVFAWSGGCCITCTVRAKPRRLVRGLCITCMVRAKPRLPNPLTLSPPTKLYVSLFLLKVELNFNLNP